MRLDDLPTPALLLDRRRLARNIESMRARARRFGVTLRPHMKTMKSARVAELATGGTGPITVSTLAEAAYFLQHGFRDITYAVGIVPAKLDRVGELMQAGAQLKILTDNVETAAAIAARGRALGLTFQVMIEIDTGLGRAGIDPAAPVLTAIADALVAPGATIAGVLAHAGHSYHCETVDEVKRVAEEERAGAVHAAERLRAAGVPCSAVSVGSTPTAVHAERLDGVTEIRPGNYMAFDLFQAGVGSCGMEDLAVSVLASVIGHHRARNHLVIDAGALALSKDVGANEHRPGTGYGLICLAGGQVPLPGLAVIDVHQEHGIVAHSKGLDAISPLPFEKFPVGSRVRVLPNHACMTAAAYDRYHVTDGGLDVVDQWDRINGW